MSSLTDEWQLKTKENAIKYIVDIENFDRKIRTFRNGRGIHSKCFKIGDSTFQVLVYPGGDSAEVKNCVSVHLENRSNWRVKANATFSIQNKNFAMILGEGFLNKSDSEGHCWGFGQFMSHCRCTRNDLLAQDGRLTLQVDLELLEEEVLSDRDLAVNETPEKLEFLKQMLTNQTAQISQLQDKIESTDLQHQTQINELKHMVRDLSLVVIENTQTPQKLQIECPVCMEVAKPPMRLKQCGQGHIICDSCHTKTEAQANSYLGVGNPLLDRCHTCRQMITGRPSQLEKIIGLC